MLGQYPPKTSIGNLVISIKGIPHPTTFRFPPLHQPTPASLPFGLDLTPCCECRHRLALFACLCSCLCSYPTRDMISRGNGEVSRLASRSSNSFIVVASVAWRGCNVEVFLLSCIFVEWVEQRCPSQAICPEK